MSKKKKHHEYLNELESPTPAEPVAKEPSSCPGCGSTNPANGGSICRTNFHAQAWVPTPAAQPTGELGTCDLDKTTPHEHIEDSAGSCVNWQPRTAAPQPVTGAPEPTSPNHEDGMEVCVKKENSPAGARERAESAARKILTTGGPTGLKDMADIIERAWAGEGKNEPS